MLTILYNDGQIEGGPGQPTLGAYNYILLKPNQWNHVVWEIPHLTRDKVTAVEFIYRLQGNEPGAATTVCYDFDQLELQTVDADHYEGWNVAPGRIAFCHTPATGLGSPKTAVASDLPTANFKLLEGRLRQDRPRQVNPYSRNAAWKISGHGFHGSARARDLRPPGRRREDSRHFVSATIYGSGQSGRR